MIDTEVFLAHYGIRGMRWGVRHEPGQGGRITREDLQKRYKDLQKNRKKAFKARSDRTHYVSSPKKLTEEELKSRIKRMETEKRYNDLNKRDISIGKKHVTDLITNIGKGTIQTVGGAAALYAIKALLFKKYGPDKINPPKIFGKN